MNWQEAAAQARLCDLKFDAMAWATHRYLDGDLTGNDATVVTPYFKTQGLITYESILLHGLRGANRSELEMLVHDLSDEAAS